MTDGAAARWTARRALGEGEPATLARLAAAFGVDADALERRARKEGWRLSGPAQGLSRAQRIARVHDRLLERIERAQVDAEAGDDLGRTAIADVSAAARLLAKVSENIRDEDAAAEEQMERDADIADILDRLDARIVALARHFAEGLVAEGVAAGRILPQAAVPGEP